MTTHRIRVLLAVVTLMLVVSAANSACAQTYTDLYHLGTNTGDPVNPGWMGLFAQGRDGNLYSTTQTGGAFVGGHQYGTIFRLTPSGSMQVLASFDPSVIGALPNSGLTLGTDGNFYGTTPTGGPVGYGTLFKVTPTGTVTVMHNFNGNTEGTTANAPPIQGKDGNFYGTTGNGGTITGTIYKMTPAGVYKVLFSFDGNVRYPQAITLGNDGNFYGTYLGGTLTNVNGGVFKVTPAGKLTVLHRFTDTDGKNPMGAIIQATDGNFYGTTRAGGTGGQGVVYKMTPAGVLTVLHNFANDTHGLAPFAGLVQATDGKFYGVTTTNPGKSSGVLFQITSTGAYADLVYFSNVAGNFKGTNPQVSLVQHTGGTLFGDTLGGGNNAGCVGCGVLYSLNMGLGPFVSILPSLRWGKASATIQFLGQGFTGTTAVSFNGVPATFTVVSDTFLTAKVPTGATSGKVTVKTPSGTLTSSQVFKVVPVITSFTPSSGSIGAKVTITGSGFGGATKVTFGGAAATNYTVNSGTQITAFVPNAGKTGSIAVTTPGGTAGKGTFTVTP